jgi:hypothetical protein
MHSYLFSRLLFSWFHIAFLSLLRKHIDQSEKDEEKKTKMMYELCFFLIDIERPLEGFILSFKDLL